MQKNIKAIAVNLWMKRIIIPSFLLLFWIGALLYYVVASNPSFFVLSTFYSKQNFTPFSTDNLLAGKKITGEIQAKEDNLGIIFIKFQEHKKIQDVKKDYLIFRLKQKDSASWYYENKYPATFIYTSPLFPFGFPVIANSKNMLYNFEIKSLKGNEENAVALSTDEPAIIAHYQFSKNQFAGNKKELLIFICKKIYNSFIATMYDPSKFQDTLFISFVYFLPFFIYVLWLFEAKVYMGHWLRSASVIFLPPVLLKKDIHIHITAQSLVNFIIVHAVYLTIFLLLTLNTFFLQIKNDVLYLVIAFVWYRAAVADASNRNISAIVGIFLLMMCPVLLLLKMETVVDQVAIWAYIFLVIGGIRAVMTLRFS